MLRVAVDLDRQNDNWVETLSSYLLCVQDWRVDKTGKKSLAGSQHKLQVSPRFP